MAEEKESGGGASSAGDIVRVVAGLAKEMPIYSDMVQPAAKELGKTLHTVARVLNVLAVPLRFTAWSGEQIEQFVQARVLPKLQHTPDEVLQPPALHIGVPVLEALRYTGADPELSELYANLLANSMDANTAHNAHPAFVDIIKSMTPDEAKVMRYFVGSSSAPLVDFKIIMKKRLFRQAEFQTFQHNLSLIGHKAQCANPLMTSSYIDNLARLGLLQISRHMRITDDAQYEEILTSRLAVEYIRVAKERGVDTEFSKHLVEVTEFGKLFIQTCVCDKSK